MKEEKGMRKPSPQRGLHTTLKKLGVPVENTLGRFLETHEKLSKLQDSVSQLALVANIPAKEVRNMAETGNWEQLTAKIADSINDTRAIVEEAVSSLDALSKRVDEINREEGEEHGYKGIN
jgi:hypothetical protein